MQVPAPLLALYLVAGNGVAQEPLDFGRIRPTSGPLERVVYDLGTGKTQRLVPPGEVPGGSRAAPALAAAAAARAACFLNTRTMGYWSMGDTGTEWRDWAVKDTGKSGSITRFFFAWHVDPGEAPPGSVGAIEVAFYEGETGFCSRSGVEIPNSRFLFTGIDPTSDTVDSAGSLRFLFTALVPTNRVFCVPDGPVGWSYGFVDDDGNGEAMTGPLMTSFVSENTGAADAYDLYNRRPSSTGTCLVSFFFGGCEPLPQPLPPIGAPCASFYIGLVEDDGSALSGATSWNPEPANPDSFASVLGPTICDDWEVVHSPVTETRSLLAVSLAGPGPSGNLCRDGVMISRLGGTALYAVGPYLRPHSVVGTLANPAPDPATHVLPVTPDLNLVGERFCTQGFGIDFSPIVVRGKNGLVVEVGTSD